MRIGVIGLGAIGGVIAARLGNAACAAGRHAGELRARGLRVDGAAPVFPEIGEVLAPGSYELIFLCTRGAQTVAALAQCDLGVESAAANGAAGSAAASDAARIAAASDAAGNAAARVVAAARLAADGAIVCVQNGLPEARVAAMAGAQRVLGAVVGWSATMRAPGEYAVTGGGKFTLGGDSPRLRDAAEILRRVFPVRVTRNLPGARWSKLAINCAMSSIGALTGLTLGEWAALPEGRALALAIVREVVRDGEARGVKFEAVAGLRPDWLARAPDFAGHAAMRLAALRRPAQRSGMIELLRAGRAAGVEDLNALIDGPVNARVVELVRAIERGERGMSAENLRDAELGGER